MLPKLDLPEKDSSTWRLGTRFHPLKEKIEACPYSRLMSVRVPRRMVDYSRILYVFPLVAAIGFICSAILTTLNGMGLTTTFQGWFGIFFGYAIVASMTSVLSPSTGTAIAFKHQSRGRLSYVDFHEDRIVFAPGSRAERVLYRGDRIELTEQRRWTELPKTPRLMGLRKADGKRRTLIDPCLERKDMERLFALISTWGQSFDQMLENYVQTMASGSCRHGLAHISDAIVAAPLHARLESNMTSDMPKLTLPAVGEVVAVTDLAHEIETRSVAVTAFPRLDLPSARECDGSLDHLPQYYDRFDVLGARNCGDFLHLLPHYEIIDVFEGRGTRYVGLRLGFLPEPDAPYRMCPPLKFGRWVKEFGADVAPSQGWRMGEMNVLSFFYVPAPKETPVQGADGRSRIKIVSKEDIVPKSLNLGEG